MEFGNHHRSFEWYTIAAPPLLRKFFHKIANHITVIIRRKERQNVTTLLRFLVLFFGYYEVRYTSSYFAYCVEMVPVLCT